MLSNTAKRVTRLTLHVVNMLLMRIVVCVFLSGTVQEICQRHLSQDNW